MKEPPHDITLRHEEKFICSYTELFLIENRIRSLLATDKNQTDDSYGIRSIYFDTYQDRMLQESLQGMRVRDKFRIRTYNTSNSIIRLEKKTSVGQLKKKTSCLLSKETVTAIIQDPYFSEGAEHSCSPFDEFSYLQKAELLSPKVIVDYQRSAYVEDVGNIRITFDKNIRATKNIQDFFDPYLAAQPILPDNLGILEVKYDSVLPGYLARALALHSLQRVSFSKYALCRNIIENNGRIEEYYEF